MSRASILDLIDLAEDRLAATTQLLTEQEYLVAELDRAGRNSEQERAALTVMQAKQARHLAARNRLRRMLTG